MFSRKLLYPILLCLSVLAFILVLIIFQIIDAKLRVVFFDVGQGDSILISQGSQQVLIDGGKEGKLLLNKLGKYVPFWDRNIEVVSMSHPDQDHIGGLVNVFRMYNVESIIQTNSQSDSGVYKALQNSIDDKKTNKIEATKDTQIIFPNLANMTIVYPFSSLPLQVAKDTNANSIVQHLIYGQSSFLFTGDLPIEKEEEILGQNIDLKSDVLKVGHHGSKYSTGDNFLDAVSPKDAIISVGKNNTYGHPNQETIQRLLRHKINIIRTDEDGDIIYECKSGKCIRSLD